MCTFAEDIEHAYFTCLGILVCSLCDWPAALLSVVITIGVRAAIRKSTELK